MLVRGESSTTNLSMFAILGEVKKSLERFSTPLEVTNTRNIAFIHRIQNAIKVNRQILLYLFLNAQINILNACQFERSLELSSDNIRITKLS